MTSCGGEAQPKLPEEGSMLIKPLIVEEDVMSFELEIITLLCKKLLLFEVK